MEEDLGHEERGGILGAVESLLPALGAAGSAIFPEAAPLIGLAQKFLPQLFDALPTL